MRKKINYLAFIVMCFCFFLARPDALMNCEYSDGKLTAKFSIKDDGSIKGSATINGTIDNNKIKNESQGIENWRKVFDVGDSAINIIGVNYYNTNKTCPPYSVFVKREFQYDFAVSNEENLKEFEKYGKSHDAYTILPLVSSNKTTGDDVKHEGGSCMEYTSKKSCEHNDYFACIWNETNFGSFCNTDRLMYVQCGDAFDIPHQIPSLFSMFVNLLKIATPIVLVIMGVISLLKSLTASKEDELKKAQQSLIKKMVAAAMVFFIISIVQFVILKVADTAEQDNVSSCLSCFLNNDCSNNVYYKTNVAGKYICKYVNGDKSTFTCKGNE